MLRSFSITCSRKGRSLARGAIVSLVLVLACLGCSTDPRGGYNIVVPQARSTIIPGTQDGRQSTVPLTEPRPTPAGAVTSQPPSGASSLPLPQRPVSLPLGSVDFGSYYALVIGNNAYRHISKLQTAVYDAQEVAQMLQQNYGFTVTLLTDVTRTQIMDELDGLRGRLTPRDNLLIYYAGHGFFDEEAGRGYWLPIDAQQHTRANWLSAADLTDSLKAMQAKHVIVVADSCYAGTLFRDVRGLIVERPVERSEHQKYFARLAQKRARTALVSGGVEPVQDGGGGLHSVFAKVFLQTLKENTGVLEGGQLFLQLRRLVAVNAAQTPEYADIRFANHEGGDFLFVRQK
jgi:hypothetical protein